LSWPTSRRAPDGRRVLTASGTSLQRLRCHRRIGPGKPRGTRQQALLPVASHLLNRRQRIVVRILHDISKGNAHASKATFIFHANVDVGYGLILVLVAAVGAVLVTLSELRSQ
jgi:hypothetical protein